MYIFLVWSFWERCKEKRYELYTCVVDVVDTDQHCLDYWWPVQRLAEHSGVLSARLGERERERERDRHCVKLAAINLHTDSEYNKGWYNYGPDRKLKIFHLAWWWPNLITNKAKCLIGAVDNPEFDFSLKVPVIVQVYLFWSIVSVTFGGQLRCCTTCIDTYH